MSAPVTLMLPFPPSVNALWRNVNGRTVLSQKAKVWWRLADGMFFLQKRNLAQSLGKPLLKFEVELVFDDKKRNQLRDIDNLSKLPMDAAQRFGLVVNDSGCQRLVSSWGKAHGGCLLTLRGVT